MLTLFDIAEEAQEAKLPFTQAQFTLLAAAFVDDEWGPHQMCSLVACRLPLHPGPCKGWKHTLHVTAPGVYHALESSRVEKANQKRLAKIAALKKEGKKVPAALLKEITYSLPKPPPEHQIGQHAEVVGGEAHAAAQAANKAAGVVANPAPKLHAEKLSTAGTDAAAQAKDTLGEAAKPKGKPEGTPKKITLAKPSEVGKHTLGEAVKAGTTQGAFEKPAAKLDNGYSPAMTKAVQLTHNAGPVTYLAHLGTLSKSDYEALTPADRKALDDKLNFIATHKSATLHQVEKADKLKAYFHGEKKAEAETPKAPEVPKAPEPVKQHQGVATADAVTGKSHADFLDSFSKMTAKDYTDLPLGDRVKVRKHLETIAEYGNADNAPKAKALNAKLLDVANMKPGVTFADHNSEVPKAPEAKPYNVHQQQAAKLGAAAAAAYGHGKAENLTEAVGKLTPSEFHQLDPQDKADILKVLKAHGKANGPFSGDKQTTIGTDAHALHDILTKGNKADVEQSPGVKATLAQMAKNHPAVKAHLANLDTPKKESVNALSEEAKGTGGGTGVNAVAKQLSEKAQVAHDLANSKGFVMSKQHLETYEPLSKDDFVSLDPDTQTTIKAQLAVALTKLKDPKKLAATQGLLDKFIDATGGPGTAKPLPAAEAAKIAEKTVEATPKIDVPAGYNPAQVKAKLAVLSTTFDDDTVLDHVWNLSKADLDGMTQDEKTALIDKVTAIKSKPGQHVVTSSVASKLLKKWGEGEAAKPEAPEVKAEPVKINHVDVPALDVSGNTWPDHYTEDMKQAATMAHQAANGTGPNLTFQQKATLVDKLTADDWKQLKESHQAKLITQINQMDESGVQGVDGLRGRFGLAKPGGPSPYAGEKPAPKPVTIIAPGNVHGSTEGAGPNHLAQIQSADFNGVGPGNAWDPIKALTPEEFKALTPAQRHAVSHYLAEIATHDVAAAAKAKELGAKLPDKLVGSTEVPGHYSQLQVNAIKAPKNDYYATSDKVNALEKLSHQDFTELTPAHQKHIMGFLDDTIAETAKTSAVYTNAAKAKAVLSGESGTKAKAATLKDVAATLTGNVEQQKKDAIEQVHAVLGKDVTATDEEIIGKAYRSAMAKGAKDALYYGTKGKWEAQHSIKNTPLKAQVNEDTKALYEATEALAIAHLHAHAGTPGAAEKLKAAEADYKAAHAKADATVAQIRKDAGLATKHIPQWNAKPNQTKAADDVPYQIGGYGKALAGHSPAAHHYLIAKLGDKNATTTYHYSKGNEKLAAAHLKEAADLEKNFEYFDQQHAQSVEAAKKALAQKLGAPAKVGEPGAPSPAVASALGVHFMPEGPTLGTGGYGTTAFDGNPAYVSPDYAAWAERGQEAAKGQDAIKKYKRIDQLTGGTKSAFVSYTGGGYEAINQDLIKAGPGGKVTGNAHLLKKAYEDTPVVDTDVVLFRGLRRMSQKFGAQANDTNMVGASFDQLGASSTSVQQSTADNFAHLGQDPFVIRILLRQEQKFRGVNAQEGGQHESEAEVILEPGLRYTVVADYGVINGRRRFDVVVDRIPTAQ